MPDISSGGGFLNSRTLLGDQLSNFVQNGLHIDDKTLFSTAATSFTLLGDKNYNAFDPMGGGLDATLGAPLAGMLHQAGTMDFSSPQYYDNLAKVGQSLSTRSSIESLAAPTAAPLQPVSSLFTLTPDQFVQGVDSGTLPTDVATASASADTITTVVELATHIQEKEEKEAAEEKKTEEDADAVVDSTVTDTTPTTTPAAATTPPATTPATTPATPPATAHP